MCPRRPDLIGLGTRGPVRQCIDKRRADTEREREREKRRADTKSKSEALPRIAGDIIIKASSRVLLASREKQGRDAVPRIERLPSGVL